jgi:hypothetical protein
VVQSLQQGDSYGATKLFSEILKGAGDVPAAPEALNAMFTNNPNANPGFAPAMGILSRAAAGNQNVWDVAAGDMSRGMSAAAGRMRPRAVALMNRLQKDLGITQSGAAALVGNLMQESGLDPGRTNTSSGAYGYAQWLDTKGSPRRSRFRAFIAAHPGMSLEEANIQFLEQEIKGGGYAGVMSALRDPDARVEYQTQEVMTGYEGITTSDPQGALGTRTGYARDVLGTMRRAGPRMTPGEAVESDPDLLRANQLQAAGGALSLWSSGITLNETYAVVITAARNLADALEHVTQVQKSQDWYHQSPGAAGVDSLH